MIYIERAWRKLNSRKLESTEQPTAAELLFRVEHAFQRFPLTNRAIWFIIASEQGVLTKEQVLAIIDAYKAHKRIGEEDNVPVNDLIDTARLPFRKVDSFLDKVVFNYDRGWIGSDNEQAAQEAVQKGEIDKFDRNEETFWDIDDWVRRDFFCLTFPNDLVKDQEFLKAENRPVTVWKPTPIGGHSAYLFRNYLDIKNAYLKDLIPHLGIDQLVKPAESPLHLYDDTPGVPKIVRRFNDPGWVVERFRVNQG